MMKILIIGRGYPTSAEPMNGIFEMDQAKALASMGHQVILGAVDLRSLRHFRLPGRKRFVQDGVQVEAVHLPAGRISAAILHRINVQAVRELYRQVLRRYGKPDVVHSHFLRMGTATVEALAGQSQLLVHTEHFSGLNMDPISPRLLRWGQQAYPQMAGIAAVSTALAHRLQDRFGVDVTVIPNPVDLHLFDAREVLSPEIEGFHFISTGHLLPNKRMDLLIRAFHAAFPADSGPDLTIFGAGPEKKKLEDMIVSGPAAKRIHLAGHQSREAVAQALQRSHAFVLLSKRETFGLAYVEALACGLPILAADSGGPADFVRPDTGRMIAGDSLEDAVLGLAAIVRDYDFYNRTAIARFARETFSPKAVAQQLTQWYQQVGVRSDEGESI